MKYSIEDIKYLNGDSFSNTYKMQLVDNPLFSRLQQIINLVDGKSVLHIGCCDHIPLIEKKIEEGTWLHGLLEDNCLNVVGVDINSEAVDYVNNRAFSNNKVYCTDITAEKGLECIPEIDYDYVLLGEIVEHVDDPVEFLKKLKENVSTKKNFTNTKIIITVPNAFVFQRGIYKKGIEAINSDHRFWFTPYTIAKVMVRAGINPLECYFVSYGLGGNGAIGITEKWFRILEKIRHKPSKYKSYRGDSLIVVGEI